MIAHTVQCGFHRNDRLRLIDCVGSLCAVRAKADKRTRGCQRRAGKLDINRLSSGRGIDQPYPG